MAGVLDTIKGKLGLGPQVSPKDAANAAADKLGGGAGNVVKAIRGRQAQIDAAVDAAVGMPKPRTDK